MNNYLIRGADGKTYQVAAPSRKDAQDFLAEFFTEADKWEANSLETFKELAHG